ncbi:UPF0481 protein At3g47200-like [Syzygium oleosum]|uniref:UPF0481 protein At3g47200-like n=1 Tax=Syzygium oleosum TaxID=219896 RepID=UPI0011D1ED66|nr:UPF0481 protein At3g47200-like [Syzygium oleosum]
MERGDADKPRSMHWLVGIEGFGDRGLAHNAESLRTIDRVPSNWRGVHNNAFDPEMICIGPLSEQSDRLWVMERHKLRFLNRLLGGKLERWRSGGDMPRTSADGERVSDDRERKEDDDGGRIAKAALLDDFVEAMRILEEETSACYVNNIHDRQFMPFRLCNTEVHMMVVDGCFVVELLRLYYDLVHNKIPAWAIEDDPILTNPQILTTLRRDLLLFENQLPFFVLEKLYELINKKNNIDHQQAVPLEELAVTFFDPLLPQRNAASKLDTEKPKAHLLEVFRSTFLKSVSEKVAKKEKNRVKSQLNPNGSMRGLVLHFASDLQEAGMQFKKWKGHDLLDIEFSHDTLQVPPLSLNDNTISLLLNFVAYELSVNHSEPLFTNYFMFWDTLVNSPRDIQILHKHGIINNFGSAEDVAKLLMRCRQVIYDLDLGYLYDEIKEVNEYCERYYESKYRVWWRSLIRERFSSPWTCLSLFAAIILLLLTLLQTFYTVYAYYRPH